MPKELFGDQAGGHATLSGVSLTFYAYPDDMKAAPMTPTIAPHGNIRDAENYRARFADGCIGSHPARATVAAGERLFKACVTDMVAGYGEFLST